MMDIFYRNFKDRLLEKYAEPLCRRIAYGVRRDLQTLFDTSMQSGDDSGLNNLWDEICVQVQGEESIFWDMYVDLIDSCIESRANKLKPHELMTIWWQNEDLENNTDSLSITKANEYDEPWDLEDNSYLMEDIVTYIRNTYIFGEAQNYRNKAISEYLFRGYEFD